MGKGSELNIEIGPNLYSAILAIVAVAASIVSLVGFIAHQRMVAQLQLDLQNSQQHILRNRELLNAVINGNQKIGKGESADATQ